MRNSKRSDASKRIAIPRQPLTTKILVDEEIPSPYPFCLLPPHYFDRLLAKIEEGGAINRPAEPWLRVNLVSIPNSGDGRR